MAPNREKARLLWQTSTVLRIAVETYRTKTFTLRLPNWKTFKPGQHADIRLTAPDGYQAQRSYSIASAPEDTGQIDLTIEMIEGGEVSPFFHTVVEPGDEIEVRGPVGGPFTWTAATGGPLLLIGGGSGIVPLMSMLRHRIRSTKDIRALLLYSSRSVEDIVYREELDRYSESDPNLTVLHTLTRAQPEGWTGYARRIDREMLKDVVDILGQTPHAYICGPSALVETAANILVSLSVPPDVIRTERFGPSGP